MSLDDINSYRPLSLSEVVLYFVPWNSQVDFFSPMEVVQISARNEESWKYESHTSQTTVQESLAEVQQQLPLIDYSFRPPTQDAANNTTTKGVDY